MRRLGREKESQRGGDRKSSKKIKRDIVGEVVRKRLRDEGEGGGRKACWVLYHTPWWINWVESRTWVLVL